ncbi:MAG: YkgJ family cysteine cluster protein [Candidatus Marinimicrobia bacterium]|nr:YkgJ family cysteine cluster protein [Candidatus Neomarinimicrobiota bacterium]
MSINGAIKKQRSRRHLQKNIPMLNILSLIKIIICRLLSITIINVIFQIEVNIIMPLELNIEKIKRYAKQREDENWRFRTFLKGMDSENIDQIVHKLYETIRKKIDCTECGNCCNSLKPAVSQNEIRNLSSQLGMSIEIFEKKYLEKSDVKNNAFYFKDIPCKFLDGKICSIYNDRPETCGSYPHLHKSGFTSRSFFFLNQYEICPIIFNLYEQLKSKLNF